MATSIERSNISRSMTKTTINSSRSKSKASHIDHRDHGRAWLVLIGAFFGGMLSSGSALTLGVLNHDIVVAMPSGTSAFAVNVVFALTTAMTYMGGTISPSLIARIGFRYTMLIGATLACVGYLSAAFSTQIWHLHVTLGFITGTGFGLIFTPSVGVVGQYFNKYKHFAATASTTGIPVGLTVFPLFHHYVAHMGGFHTAMFANVGVSAFLFLCALAVKDPPDMIAARRSNISETRKQRQVMVYFYHSVRALVFGRRATGKVAHDDLTAAQWQGIKLEAQNSPQTTFSDGRRVHEAKISALSFADSGRGESLNGDVTPRIISNVDNGEDFDTISNAETAPAPSSPMPGKKERSLLCVPKTYFLLVQGLSLIAINIFLITTPAYLVQAHGWAKSNATFALMTHGAASLVCRPIVLLLNVFPRVGDRISKPLQVMLGIFCVMACSTAYFFSYMFTPDLQAISFHHLLHTVEHRHPRVDQHQQNATFANSSDFSASTTAAPLLQVRNVFHESHAFYYLGFAFVNGVGNTLFLAYQPSLVLEIFGAQHLTRAFGYMGFVWGAGCLVLYPLAGKLGDIFGSLHYAYLLACASCVLSVSALGVLVVLHKLELRQAAAKQEQISVE